jgi:DNA-binding NarL/FixJ family response regulator
MTIAPAGGMIRVLLADDHVMFRDMMRIALPRAGEIEIIGEAGDGQQLLDVLHRLRPEVLVLDYKMPYVRDFRALLEQVAARAPDTRPLVLSAFANLDMVTRAAEGGARAYVLKTTRLSAVVDAVRTVAAGGVWIDPSLPRKLFGAFQRLAGDGAAPRGETDALSRREREVLACMAHGASNRDIAGKLSISQETVKTHLRRIFAKLGVRNRVEAALAFHGRLGGRETPSAAA